MEKIKPTRRQKNKGNGFYKLDSGCGKIAITIKDSEEDGYPIRFIVEEIGGGCSGNAQLLRKVSTFITECNIDLEEYADVLDTIICPAAKSRMLKNPGKEIYLSCAKTMAFAIKDHLRKIREQRVKDEEKEKTE